MRKLGAAFTVAVLGWSAPCRSAMTIVINPDAGLAANPAALAAFNRAAAEWTNAFTNNITITIDAGLSSSFSNASIIGHTSPVEFQANYDFFRGKLIASAAKDPNDSIVAYLPTVANFKATLPVGITFSGKFIATKANFKALGYSGLDAQYGATDATITFNSNFAFDYDASDGVSVGKIDFQSVAAHEIGHALGFISSVDTVDAWKAAGTSGQLTIAPLDAFRFQPGSTAVNPSTPQQFTDDPRYLNTGGSAIFDDLSTELAMSTGYSTGDGREAAHWKDDQFTGHLLGVMDPSITSGIAEYVGPNDIRALDLIGYDVVPEPAAVSLISFFGLLLHRPGQRIRQRRAPIGCI